MDSPSASGPTELSPGSYQDVPSVGSGQGCWMDSVSSAVTVREQPCERACYSTTELEMPGSGCQGGPGSRVSRVWPRNPVMRPGYRWTRSSWCRIATASWSVVPGARLPMLFFIADQAPSTEIRPVPRPETRTTGVCLRRPQLRAFGGYSSCPDSSSEQIHLPAGAKQPAFARSDCARLRSRPRPARGPARRDLRGEPETMQQVRDAPQRVRHAEQAGDHCGNPR